MKILLITQHYPPEIGAASNRMDNLSKSLIKEGHELTVLTHQPCYPNCQLYKNSNIKTESSNGSITILRTPLIVKEYSKNKFKRLLLYMLFIFFGLIEIIKLKGEYQLIITTSPPIFVGLLGSIAKFKFKCPMYFDIRDLWPSSVEAIGIFNGLILKPAYLLERYLYNRADKLLITSGPFKDYLVKKEQPVSKIIYLPNGVSSEKLKEFQIDIERNFSEVRVVYAGTVGYAQGLQSIIDAANKLKNNQNIKFVIIGAGVELSKIKNYANQKQLANIEFMGALEHEGVIKELLRSHIALLHLKNSQIFETVIPSKLFEYMAAKLPIVAGVKGEAARIINESKAGLTCSPDDFESMADRILRLAEEKENREIMGTQGYSYLLKNFHWDQGVRKLTSTLK